jgi:hypothetical protein
VPFVTWEQANATPNLQLTRPEDEPTALGEGEAPSLRDTAVAAARLGSYMPMMFNRAAAPWMDRWTARGLGAEDLGWVKPPSLEDIKDYSPFADPQLESVDPDDFHLFLRSRSPEETAFHIRKQAAERRDVETVARSGFLGKALVGAFAVTDPLTLLSMAIPAAAPVAWGSRAERIAAAVAATAATDLTVEAALHESQDLRTIQDSLLNVGAGVFLSSAVGAWATRMPKSEFDTMARDLQRDMGAPDNPSVGAARVGGETTLDDEGIAKGGKFLARTMGQISPLVRTLSSSTKEARVLAERLVNIPFMKQKNLRGVPLEQSVESRIGQRAVQSRLFVVQNFDHAYNKYRQSAGADALSLREFGVKVSQAMRRGDISDISEASEFARHMRKMFEEDRKAFEELGVLPEEIGTLGARSYFPRVYDHNAIMKDQLGFSARLREWFTNNPKRLEETADVRAARARTEARALGKAVDDAEDAAQRAADDAALIKDFDKRQREALNTQRDPAEIESAVQDTIDSILGTMRNGADLGRISNPRPLKSRVLDVPDEVLEPFLVSDFEQVMQGYIRTVTPNIEMRKTFGSTDLAIEKKEVNEAYNVKIANAKSNKEAQRLKEEAGKVQRDLEGMRRRVMNEIGPTGRENVGWVRAARIARQYNYVRLLGGQTMSSLSDYGHVISKYGLVKTGKATAKFLTNISYNKMTRADNQRLGTAVDWILDTRTGSIADIADDLSGGTGFWAGVERAGRTTSAKFTRLTLMSTWNSTIKNLTSILEQDAIIRAAQNPKKLTPYQRAKIPFTDDELERVAAQFAKHGETDGLMRAATGEWTDKALAKKFEAFIIDAGEQMAIARGAGDLPLTMDSEMAKTLLQFKSFGMASVNRLMIPVAQGLAHGDVAAANGLAVMLGLGALTYYTKEKAAGRAPDLSPETVAKESLAWSGVMGFLPDLSDPAASVMPEPIRSKMRLSRFSDRAPFETFLGPSFGTASDLFLALSNATGPTSDEDMTPSLTASDIHKLRKIVPLQNLAYLRRIINAVEGETAEAMGAEGATSQDFWDRVTAEEPAKVK